MLCQKLSKQSIRRNIQFPLTPPPKPDSRESIAKCRLFYNQIHNIDDKLKFIEDEIKTVKFTVQTFKLQHPYLTQSQFETDQQLIEDQIDYISSMNNNAIKLQIMNDDLADKISDYQLYATKKVIQANLYHLEKQQQMHQRFLQKAKSIHDSTLSRTAKTQQNLKTYYEEIDIPQTYNNLIIPNFISNQISFNQHLSKRQNIHSLPPIKKLQTNSSNNDVSSPNKSDTPFVTQERQFREWKCILCGQDGHHQSLCPELDTSQTTSSESENRIQPQNDKINQNKTKRKNKTQTNKTQTNKTTNDKFII